MRGKLFCCIVIAAGVIMLGGCERNNEIMAVGTENSLTGEQEVDVVEENRNKIIESGVSETIAQWIANDFEESGVGALDTVESMESEQYENILIATDQDLNQYYVSFDPNGYFIYIREDSETGKVLYGPVD